MKRILLAGMSLLLLSTAGAASAEEHYGYLPSSHGGPDCPPHDPSVDCLCDREAVFYRPNTPWADRYVRGGPGVRVYGRPVLIASGRIDIEAPPVYVDAPPVRIAAPQIYLHRPQVYVRPADVTVEPPEIHYTGCEDGSACQPVGPAH